jgi:hypothetical protein
MTGDVARLPATLPAAGEAHVAAEHAVISART